MPHADSKSTYLLRLSGKGMKENAFCTGMLWFMSISASHSPHLPTPGMHTSYKMGAHTSHSYYSLISHGAPVAG